MEKCEAYKTGQAFNDESKGITPIVLCEIERCPYNQQGPKEVCLDGKERYLCLSHASVENQGKLITIEGKSIPKSSLLGCMTGN
jgi:hypothetical protein